MNINEPDEICTSVDDADAPAGTTGGDAADTAYAQSEAGNYSAQSLTDTEQDGDSTDEAVIGHPRVRRICRAAHIDMQEARLSRWMDTVDLISQRAPQYLQPFLVYVDG